MLRCVATKAVKNVCGAERFGGTTFKSCDNVSCLYPNVIHCIIHQQVFCKKYFNLPCVIERVASTVNFIRSHELNYHRFHKHFPRSRLIP